VSSFKSYVKNTLQQLHYYTERYCLEWAVSTHSRSVAVRGMFIRGGLQPTGFGGSKSPRRVQNSRASMGSQGQSHRSWSSLQTLCTDYDCRNDQNL